MERWWKYRERYKEYNKAGRSVQKIVFFIFLQDDWFTKCQLKSKLTAKILKT